jgi:AcrR family transcriptional regulator
MARPKEFDRDTALDRAMTVFWSKGYAATSTDDLLSAMGIGRQSMYDSFGDKRRLYLEALARYQDASVSAHIERLRGKKSPLAGIEAMLAGVVADDRAVRERGCMGVNAVSELGCTDPDVTRMRGESDRRLSAALRARLDEAREAGELRRGLDVDTAAAFIGTTMLGLQVGARAGRPVKALREIAQFAVASLR